MASIAPGASAAVEARQLVKRYGVVTAVDGVSFSVARGEIFGFLGANGAGKTTTLRMLCGLLTPTSGSALIDGIDILRDPLRAKGRLGYLDEEPFVHPHLTGREFLNFVADLYRMPRGAQREQRMERLLGLFELANDGFEVPVFQDIIRSRSEKADVSTQTHYSPACLLLGSASRSHFVRANESPTNTRSALNATFDQRPIDVRRQVSDNAHERTR